MIGWPTFSPWRSTSTTKFGEAWVPNWWLNRSRQDQPHDGVAALAVPAVSAPAAPTPPTMVSVAAAASTLLLMDMGVPLLNSQPRPARGCVELAPRGARSELLPDRSVRCRLAVAGQAGNAACRSCRLERHGSGRAP